MNSGLAIAGIIALVMLLPGCEEDRSQAEAAAGWLAERRLFRPFGEIGEISKVSVESADLIRMQVSIPDKRHTDAIDAQSLMVQSLIAKYACPGKGADIWQMLGEDIVLRVDLTSGDETIASGICRGP